MNTRSNPKDLGAGILYLAFGAAAIWLAHGNPIGTADDMGPSYFPVMMGLVLIVVGLISTVRSFLVEGEPIGAIALKPLAFVVGSTCLFAWAVPRLGAPIALLLLLFASAAASRQFRLNALTVAVLGGLVAAAVLIFIRGLGIPMPLLGTYFDG
ncbi:tripartite tricarboxylate transporter TctB family protein [Aureimonas flava]|uniref:Tripartite tricarboxylate transporter TctB family protein n=1 Tax=Aureimonas flava TaxID=2320271 RepID=A0A3A1WKR6_9HYPH|nr:tripartite tricarboxylate transporter TctB family protein [Aureimonas flava]RIX99730.1 tripartite tricarboxylate transporter TctB family protein [Aureimonas flava]